MPMSPPLGSRAAVQAMSPEVVQWHQIEATRALGALLPLGPPAAPAGRGIHRCWAAPAPFMQARWPLLVLPRTVNASITFQALSAASSARSVRRCAAQPHTVGAQLCRTRAGSARMILANPGTLNTLLCTIEDHFTSFWKGRISKSCLSH